MVEVNALIRKDMVVEIEVDAFLAVYYLFAFGEINSVWLNRCSKAYLNIVKESKVSAFGGQEFSAVTSNCP